MMSYPVRNYIGMGQEKGAYLLSRPMTTPAALHSLYPIDSRQRPLRACCLSWVYRSHLAARIKPMAFVTIGPSIRPAFGALLRPPAHTYAP